MSDRPLGRRVPTDWEHIERYPLRVAAFDATPTAPVPVVLGINWYTNFDAPVKRGGEWHIGDGDLGSIRGGHSICARPNHVTDDPTWWRFYDQGNEGACVGFSASRCMTLLNRKRYDAEWLYHEAQRIDEWEGEDYDGTSVRAAMDVLRTTGARAIKRGKSADPSPAEGISENRWATTVEQVLQCLGMSPSASAIPLLNSWGREYPHVVWLNVDALARLLHEDGEATLITDRMG
jgi:hypothetical protein